MTALVPSADAGQQYHHPATDPFANPNANSIQTPKPCAQVPRTLQSMRDAAASRRTNTSHEQFGQQSPNIPYKARSISTTSDSIITPMSSIDLEKSSIAPEQAPRMSAQTPRRSGQDAEKAMYSARDEQQRPANPHDAYSLTYSEDDGEDDGRRLQEQKAVKILLFLSGPCVVLSALNTAWTCISLVITLLTQPVRLCARRPTFGQQLAGLIGPALNLQLKSIYTPLPPYANEDSSYNAFTLVMVHMLSPFLSLGMMFVAWVLAAYWLSSAIVGDPAGMDKRDDGRETVLSLRRWWEHWLMRSVKEQ